MGEAFLLEPALDRRALNDDGLRALYDLWRRAGGNAALAAPAVAARFEPLLTAGLRDGFWWLDQGEPTSLGIADFTFRHVGPAAQRLYGADPSGLSLVTLARQPYFARVAMILRTVLGSGLPHRFFSADSVIPTAHFHDIEALALPLAGADGRIRAVAGATVAHEE